MISNSFVNQKDKMKRLSTQLAASKKLLAAHPLTQSNLTSIQTALHYLELQLKWSSADEVARLLITFQIALQGKESHQSVTGFIGPCLSKILKEVTCLMQAPLKLEQKNCGDLLETFNTLLLFGTFYLCSQLTDRADQLFSLKDAVTSFKAQLLLKELGLNFLLASHSLENAYQAVTEGLKIEEKKQKQIKDIGSCFILSALILAEDLDRPFNEDFILTLQGFLLPALPSLESAVQEGQFQGIIEKEQVHLVLSQIQLIKQVIEKGETVILKEIFKKIFEIFNFSYEELQKDLKQIMSFCNQLTLTFKNIFYQSKQRSTLLTQLA